jgi:hypothetical protein
MSSERGAQLSLKSETEGKIGDGDSRGDDSTSTLMQSVIVSRVGEPTFASTFVRSVPSFVTEDPTSVHMRCCSPVLQTRKREELAGVGI